jgi:hypothetical protein
VDSADLLTEQPMPTQNDQPSVQHMVIADIQARMQVGLERYGTLLKPGNGRDALRDLYEELLDGAMYARQAIEERPREDVDAAVAAVRAELEPQIARMTDLAEELRRRTRPLQRQSEAWVTLLRLCATADREHREQTSTGSAYARIPTDTIRAVLDQTPYPDATGGGHHV